MPKKRKKSDEPESSEGGQPHESGLPGRIDLAPSIWPPRGYGFLRILQDRAERGDPVPTLRGTPPPGYTSDFEPEVDAPRAPLQSGWYIHHESEVPVYAWVHDTVELAREFPEDVDLWARGYAPCTVHSIWTMKRGKRSERGEVDHVNPVRLESWTPIVAPDPAIVAADQHGVAPVYATPVVGPLPALMPHRIAAIDVDYARVGGDSLPEKWDIDVVGVLVVEREPVGDLVGHGQWKQVEFHVLRATDISRLASIAAGVDLIVGHNLFDADYRCLRTYADQVNLDPVLEKSVDTLYFARRVLSGGHRKPAGLDLTSLVAVHQLRQRRKVQSRTTSHRGITSFPDAEERWFYEPVSDDCERVLELWLDMVANARLLVPGSGGRPSERPLSPEERLGLLTPPLTGSSFAALLAARGTVYELPGSASEESAARIHRQINELLASGDYANDHGPLASTRRCPALADAAGGQCAVVVHGDETYCRAHRKSRLCRGNPAIDEPCDEHVDGERSHCHWHRRTALYVAPGTRVHEDFRCPVELPGWEQMSIWGFDTGLMSFFAQLWRNSDSPADNPRHWLHGVDPVYQNIVELRPGLKT
ncbi:hypothetical protein NLX83_33845 [Allokutzneria sp. A3M-2-11 16]|uniref:hypothetical protein n=1 Tax=Allokutzneria sp. A3M-2-11 16 TaxID=2962043 RepID=UPI0020B6E709|nr:hypothetical protein [Allokutzneria sp. A3M-2-11 16]MCP3804265.1 hypothetical protein [Allokutzneria sp. A3M-2-11 16]